MNVRRLILLLSGGCLIIALGRHVGNGQWWAAGFDVLLICLLLYVNARLIYQEDRIGHRPGAMNCRFFIGDQDPIDWGTCVKCEKEAKRESAR